MATATDLWGELDAKALVRTTPLSIMREQAALLGQKTGNLVEAQVHTETQYGNSFVLQLNLVVPSLDNYTYQLLKVTHPVSLYPVKVSDVYPPVELKDEAAFIEWLRGKLSSSETRGIVGNLLSQAAG